MLMATKHGRVVTYNEELTTVKSQDPLITCSCKVTLQIEYVISPLPQWLLTVNPGKVVTCYAGLPSLKSRNPFNTRCLEITWQIKNIFSLLPQWLCPTNCECWLHELKVLNLICHNTYFYQTFQGGDFLREAPTLKVTLTL